MNEWRAVVSFLLCLKRCSTNQLQLYARRHQYGHSYLINDGVQGAKQQEAPPPDQVLAQRHHVTLLLILVPRLCSLGDGAAQLVDVRQELPGQGVAGATHVWAARQDDGNRQGAAAAAQSPKSTRGMFCYWTTSFAF